MKIIKIRAIYIGDIRFNECNVFELNEETNYFEMLNDKEFKYEREIVEDNGEWLLFQVTTKKQELEGRVKLIKKVL